METHLTLQKMTAPERPNHSKKIGMGFSSTTCKFIIFRGFLFFDQPPEGRSQFASLSQAAESFGRPLRPGLPTILAATTLADGSTSARKPGGARWAQEPVINGCFQK